VEATQAQQQAFEADTSTGRVLVAYGTKHGATKEIADRIGQVLSASGYTVDVRNASEIADVSPYQAIVVGSAVYMARWRPETLRLLRRNRSVLAERDLWLFSSGPFGNGSGATDACPPKVKRLANELGALQEVTFGGKIPEHPHGIASHVFVRAMKGRAQDSRDWQRIGGWAEEIADSLSTQGEQEI
jgi:menaquinone-dependent protoporphyrinogen oxidase